MTRRQHASSFESVAKDQEASLLRIADEDVSVPVGRNAVPARSRGSRAEKRELAPGRYTEHGHRRALRARKIQMQELRVVVDDIHAASGTYGRELLAGPHVQRDGLSFRTPREEEPAGLVERDPTGPLAAVVPGRGDRPGLDVDRHGLPVPEVGVRAAAPDIHDERLRPAGNGKERLMHGRWRDSRQKMEDLDPLGGRLGDPDLARWLHVPHVVRRAAELRSRHDPPASRINDGEQAGGSVRRDRKSTRLNSSHVRISYAVFCLKKKNKKK